MGNGDSTQIHQYSINSKLGSGSLGEVFKADYAGSLYAIKRVSIQPGDNFFQEIMSFKKLDHENVVKYVEKFVEEGYCWTVMKYFLLGDLNTFLLNQTVKKDILLNWIKQILNGLKYLESQRIYHRNIKPTNIIINSKNGSHLMMIADFGYSNKFSLGESVCGAQLSDLGYGPPFYTAPEIRKGTLGFASDIFSLGCMVLAMFARTSVQFGDKKVLAAYCDSREIADIDDKDKRKYLEKHIILADKEKQKKFQQLVFRMVKYDMDERPSACQALSLMDGLV